MRDNRADDGNRNRPVQPSRFTNPRFDERNPDVMILQRLAHDGVLDVGQHVGMDRLGAHGVFVAVAVRVAVAVCVAVTVCVKVDVAVDERE